MLYSFVPLNSDSQSLWRIERYPNCINIIQCLLATSTDFFDIKCFQEKRTRKTSNTESTYRYVFPQSS